MRSAIGGPERRGAAFGCAGPRRSDAQPVRPACRESLRPTRGVPPQQGLMLIGWYAPAVSKAFTKEDDGEGLAPIEARKLKAPFRLTADGARMLARSEDPRVREA